MTSLIAVRLDYWRKRYGVSVGDGSKLRKDAILGGYSVIFKEFYTGGLRCLKSGVL